MDSCIRLWDYVSGSVKKTYQGHENSTYSIGGCFGSLDGENAFVVASSEDGDIVLWDVKTKEIVQRIEKAHDGVTFWVDVKGDTMVSCGQDGKIKVFQHRRPGTINGISEPKVIEQEVAVTLAENGDVGMVTSQSATPFKEDPEAEVDIKTEE
jgi:COMPASS component SWD3